ncbi:hypothetical protein E4U41_006016 [Claviceps citrina]|nr:hypothetical protein E4U41_006016 [Claviceps citrina]
MSQQKAVPESPARPVYLIDDLVLGADQRLHQITPLLVSLQLSHYSSPFTVQLDAALKIGVGLDLVNWAQP